MKLTRSQQLKRARTVLYDGKQIYAGIVRKKLVKLSIVQGNTAEESEVRADRWMSHYDDWAHYIPNTEARLEGRTGASIS